MLSTVDITDYAREVDAINDLALDDLTAALSGLDPWDAHGFKRTAIEVTGDLLHTYGDTAASLSADMYDEWRELEMVPGSYRATPAKLAELSVIESNVAWSMSSMFGPKPDVPVTIGKVGGALTRHISAAAGDTMAGNAEADPKASGWVRLANTSACTFCKMLSGKHLNGGATYKSRKTVRFRSHDHCKCRIAPAWDLDASESLEDVKFQRSTRPHDAAGLREYLAANREQIEARAVLLG